MSVFRQVTNNEGVDVRLTIHDDIEWRIVNEAERGCTETAEYPFRKLKGDGDKHIFTVGTDQVLQIIPASEAWQEAKE